MRIVIADDHPLFRDGLKHLLRQAFDDPEVIEAGNFAAVWDALDTDPDLLVIDLVFPGFEPQQDLPKLRDSLPVIPIVVMSMLNDPRRIARIMQSGVNGFVSKSSPPEEIRRSLDAIMAGECVVSAPDVSPAQETESDIGELLRQLSERQSDVLRGICRGQSNKEIARELNLSPHTVRLHVSGVLQTLRVSSRTAAATVALANGFRSPEDMQ